MADLAKLGILVDSTQAATATGRLDGLTASAGRAEGATSGLGSTFRTVGKTLATGALIGGVVALGAAFRRSIERGKEFEQSLAEVEAITGIAGQALDDLSDQALDASAETGRAASQIVEAYKLVASQLAEKIDFGTATGQRVLQQVAEDATTLSIAAGIDLKTAVEGTTTAINQFNLKAEDATKVVNLLAAGSKFGAAEVADIQEALTDAGIAASVAGEDLNTTIAAIEVLGANAIKGGRAGTALKNVFVRLQTETQKLADLGIKNVNIQSDGLVETLRKLNPIADDAAALTDVFGQRAFSAAGLLIKYVDSLEDLTEKQKDTQTATEQAAVQLDTFEGASNRLSTTLDKELIAAFQETNGAGVALINTLTSLVSATGAATRTINRFFDRASRADNIQGDDKGILSYLFFGFGDELFGQDEALAILDELTAGTENTLFRVRNLANGIADARTQLASLNEEDFEFDIYSGVISDNVSELESLESNLQTSVNALEVQRDAAKQAGGEFGIFEETLREYRARLSGVQQALQTVSTTTKDLGNDTEETEGKVKASATSIARSFQEIQVPTFTDNDLLGDIDRQLQQFEQLGELFEGYDVGAAKLHLLKREITDLVQAGKGNSATVSELTLKYNTLGGVGIKAIEGIEDKTEDGLITIQNAEEAVDSLGFTFSSAFEDAVISGNSLRDVLNGILEDITRIILRTQVTKPLAEGLAGFLGGALEGSASTPAEPTAQNLGDALITDDGKLYNFHPDDNILAFQGSPSKKIPGNSGGGNVTVNVINNNGSQVETTQRKTADGGIEIGVMIDERVKDSINSGRFDRNFQSNFNLNRSGY